MFALMFPVQKHSYKVDKTTFFPALAYLFIS